MNVLEQVGEELGVSSWIPVEQRRIDAFAALTGDYQTTAKLTVAGFDVGKPLALFGDSSLKGSSSINGVVDVSGPAKTPLAMAGSAVILFGTQKTPRRLASAPRSNLPPPRVALRSPA